jgi:hypothetical protein
MSVEATGRLTVRDAKLISGLAIRELIARS